MVASRVMRGRIEQVVRDVIRPLVEADSGWVQLEVVTADEVVVSLHGACAGCPGAHYTRTHVVEPALRKVVGPDVRIEVRAVAKGVAAGANDRRASSQ